MTNVVMLVRDRYRLTRQSLESLNATLHESAFNLTIVDDGSTDFRVRRLLDGQWPQNTSVLHVRQSGHVLSKLKNLGVYWSRKRFGEGDWLYLSDNDVYFKPNWLETLTTAAEQSEPSGFRLWGGQAHPFHRPINLLDGDDTLNEHDCLAGTSWLMRWSTWDIYGPLDGKTASGVCQSEDWAFTQRARNVLNNSPHEFRIGVVHPHVVLDCGLTNSDGKPSPGYDQKPIDRTSGVYYE